MNDELPLKIVAEMFFFTKGHLSDEKTMRGSYEGYFKRLWNNNERAVYASEEFEKAWAEYKRARGM